VTTTAAAMTATEAAVTSAETALRATAGASAVHGAAETAVRSAGEAAAMHTAAKTRLPAGGIMVCETTMVESTECAGALTRRHVRRSKPAVGAVVDRSAAKARAAIRKTMSRSTPKIRAMCSEPAVDKGGTPGDEPVVIENHEPVVPIEAPGMPTPVKVAVKVSEGKTHIEPNNRPDEETPVEIPRICQQGRPVYDPRIILRKIDDFRIRRFDNYRLISGCHGLLRRGFKSAGVLRSLTHNLDGVEDVL
jgi:hypothetical protein